MEIDRHLDSVRKVSIVIDALKAGTLKVRAEDEVWARQLLSLPRGITGLVDISSLSPKTLSMVRAAALGVQFFHQEATAARESEALGSQDAQCRLFDLYERLFRSLINIESPRIISVAEIKARMLDRVSRGDDFSRYNEIIDELGDFYKANAGPLFRTAGEIGGLKSIAGGQRRFGPSALAATRISGLYCDTQLIPDPVYPHLTGNLHLNAAPLQLAIALFHILPLRPLVDARLPEPPIFVFPSFEETLEENDAITQAGLESLTLKIVAPFCSGTISSLEELYEYARKEESTFLDVVTAKQLFIPPGGAPGEVRSAEETIRIYMEDMKGVRSANLVSQLEKLPPGVLMVNGILERVRPIFHLLENANELSAQPLLSQEVHWHYFERCAEAESVELVNKKLLPKESLVVLRALQDESLTWLANIPVEGLTELRRNREHAEMREQLKKCTAQLVAAGDSELPEVVKEVRHGLEVLVQGQQKSIREIEAKYSPKKWGGAVGGALSAATAASMHFMPALAAFAGVSTPVASAIAGLAGGGLMVAREQTGEFVDKRRARKSMVGLLATAKLNSK